MSDVVSQNASTDDPVDSTTINQESTALDKGQEPGSTPQVPIEDDWEEIEKPEIAAVVDQQELASGSAIPSKANEAEAAEPPHDPAAANKLAKDW